MKVCSFSEKCYLVYREHTCKKRLWIPLWCYISDAIVSAFQAVLSLILLPVLILWLIWVRMIWGPIRDIRKPLSDQVIEIMRKNAAKAKQQGGGGALE